MSTAPTDLLSREVPSAYDPASPRHPLDAPECQGPYFRCALTEGDTAFEADDTAAPLYLVGARPCPSSSSARQRARRARRAPLDTVPSTDFAVVVTRTPDKTTTPTTDETRVSSYGPQKARQMPVDRSRGL
ncbi:hypothetical protein Q5752_000056 [Cryptotrichosporon argae]